MALELVRILHLIIMLVAIAGPYTTHPLSPWVACVCDTKGYAK